MTLIVKHVVGAPIDGVQSCIMCGCVLQDLRNASWISNDPNDNKPPWYPEGEMWIQGKNPQMFLFQEPDEEYIDCTDLTL